MRTHLKLIMVRRPIEMQTPVFHLEPAVVKITQEVKAWIPLCYKNRVVSCYINTVFTNSHSVR
jgi:hypothetical protein